MQWPELFELTLNGIAQGGEGVGRWEERVVFVRGGLPGETVRVALRDAHDSYARADVVEVLAAAPERAEPRLPGADHMPWQHVAYSAQLAFKRQILAEQLAKIGGLENIAVAETLAASPPWGYRNTARLHGQGAELGYYAAGSRELQPIDADPLLMPVLNDALAALRDVVKETGSAPTEVLLRVSETHRYVVAALRGAGDLRRLAGRWRMGCPALAGVVLPPHRSAPAEALGADRLIEELEDVAFDLAPTTFFQVNLASATALLDVVREHLAPRGDERLLDLYCGAGTFALPLSSAVAEVLGVEEVPGAVADGRLSAEENGMANVQFEVGRTEAVLATLDGPFDAVVLDPPRRGCHPAALENILRLAPTRVVYVSCHPATLARDLKILTDSDYRVTFVQPVDLFPQTAHIESVAVLER